MTHQENLDALDAGACTAQCILAKDDDEECDCRCNGQFHGLMRDTPPTHADPFKGMGVVTFYEKCDTPRCCNRWLPAGLRYVLGSAGFYDGAHWLMVADDRGSVELIPHSEPHLRLYESMEAGRFAWEHDHSPVNRIHFEMSRRLLRERNDPAHLGYRTVGESH